MASVVRTCPECDAANPPKATTCQYCSTQLGGGKRGDRPTYDDRCAWSWGQGRRCRLSVEGWPGQTPKLVNNRYQGWCGWHLDTMRMPNVVDDREAFNRWWEFYAGSIPYCTVWTHYPLDHLWALTLGENPGFRLGDPCRVGSCPNRPVEPYTGPWPPTPIMWADLQLSLEQIGQVPHV